MSGDRPASLSAGSVQPGARVGRASLAILRLLRALFAQHGFLQTDTPQRPNPCDACVFIKQLTITPKKWTSWTSMRKTVCPPCQRGQVCLPSVCLCTLQGPLLQ